VCRFFGEVGVVADDESMILVGNGDDLRFGGVCSAYEGSQGGRVCSRHSRVS
jgi:hypothetical protein